MSTEEGETVAAGMQAPTFVTIIDLKRLQVDAYVDGESDRLFALSADAGVGKTTLSQSIAQVFGLAFNRIQFTSDLLPADILGVSVFNRDKATFEFHPGPVFAQLVLADEINRTTPKSQSALLEAMEERQQLAQTLRRHPELFTLFRTQQGHAPLGHDRHFDRVLLHAAHRIDTGSDHVC